MLKTYKRSDVTNSQLRGGPSLQCDQAKASESGGDASVASPSAAFAPPVGRLPPLDDLSREVYCILGVPIDAIGMHAVLRQIEQAASTRTRFLLSTPNLNSLVISQSDKDYRESLILSDLCTADGVSI